MPRELPGFYYDAQKNRYFPIKGPIPGSSRASSSATNAQLAPSEPIHVNNVSKRTGGTTSKLLQSRELNGNIIPFNKGKFNFMDEIQKIQASQPIVWKYQGTEMIGDCALDQIHIDVNTPGGQTQVDILLTGSVNGSLSLFEVGKVGQHFDDGVKYIPDFVWPDNRENKAEKSKSSRQIWRPLRASLQMSSSISSIKVSGKHSRYAVADGLNFQHALITTLGSETSGGSVCILNLVEPLDFYSSAPISQVIHEVASLDCTIWTADCNLNASKAVIGTNLGAALINLETGRRSWVCQSKSDVLCQQLDQSGNVLLCGLRNGAILTVDVRENQERSSDRLIRHRIPYSHLGTRGPNSRKQWFEIKGKIYPSSTFYMPLSICCLVSLQSYDQYFLASSMDGMIKLYDHRMTKRGAVQSYEGNVNSHTRLQLGVDPSERFLMAGGEDFNTRIWSLKSGELLFNEKFSDSVPAAICWRSAEKFVRITDEGKICEEFSSGKNCGSGAWIGSRGGLFYMHWT